MPSFSYRSQLHLPGFTSNVDLVNITRAGFSRVDAAAAHPIEYAVVTAVLAPIALHYALHSRTRAMRLGCWAALACLFAVTPMTVSRSGVLALVVCLAVYAPALTARHRLNALLLVPVALLAFSAAVPGLLGTLRSLFFAGSQDPSIAGREADYAKLPGLLQGHEIFGRGLGTFQPAQYFFLDNQYLGTWIEAGAVGLVALVALFLVGMGTARGARKWATDVETRSLGQALAAAIAGLAITGGTFDQMSFRQSQFLVFLLIGCAGSLWWMQRGPLDAASVGATADPAVGGSDVVGQSREQAPHRARSRTHRR